MWRWVGRIKFSGSIAVAWAVFVGGLPSVALFAQSEQRNDSAGVEFFEKRIRAILVEQCYECHGTDKQESGLMLASRSGLRAGGDRGRAVLEDQPGNSLLLRAIAYSDEDLKMPPRGKLSDEHIADLTTWVKRGAPMPAELSSQSHRPQPAAAFNLLDRMDHWAYQPVRPAAPPIVKNADWCTLPVDRFVLEKLDAVGLVPALQADPGVLIRRLTFDLTGLPPTPAEVTSFTSDDRPDAFERLVDRLLASPHYGERWARHWLDVMRFSETQGFEFDYDLHNAWRYRDYVIGALNDDLPYDQFVNEHLAGDLLTEPRRNVLDGSNESILATGFYWMLEGKQSPVDIRQEQADRIDNQIDTIGKAFLGQTISCARCHDHKFDAISTRDYYALAGYLRSSRFQQAYIDPPEATYATMQALRELRSALQVPARTLLASRWKTQVNDVDRYLRASVEVESEAGSFSNLNAVARKFNLESVRLESWCRALEATSLDAVDHPMYAWRNSLRSTSKISSETQKARLPAVLETPTSDPQRSMPSPDPRRRLPHDVPTVQTRTTFAAKSARYVAALVERIWSGRAGRNDARPWVAGAKQRSKLCWPPSAAGSLGTPQREG